ncbi:lipoprotein-releasing ABC transporter ATP-binding protein LolD [Thiomicrorhabdus sp. Kp2]|uniref:lipoprotein-releasing ABC transporter ATP-binding protein LolD n=1 Tax=Thiomicrorhabdus sp. Kp2 TaxID=1123518 RepID=UPI0003FF1496|nr:lipoprotein-releasing ABC transporter ATP-binding protein LolD [Thiomicrorhabdus sp. Kp2]
MSNEKSNEKQNLVLQATGLGKTYKEGELETKVFSDIDFQLKAGEKVAIVGASGSGKSTLLHLLAGLDTPTQGEVLLNGLSFSSESDVKRGKLRNQYMGFVYQFHHLFSELTALENVMMPLQIRRVSIKEAQKKAHQLLEKVGLANRAQHKPSELSGGERQRVAIARALITEPACILADEPTGNLDYASADQVFQLLVDLNTEFDTALLIVTHDLSLAAKMDRQVTLLDGHLVHN